MLPSSAAALKQNRVYSNNEFGSVFGIPGVLFTAENSSQRYNIIT